METFTHEYKGFGGCQSMCKVYHDEKNGFHYFCFEDMNTGTSVTNMSEHLATEMVRKYYLSPLLCRFFESYVHQGKRDSTRTLDEITYSWKMRVASDPEWMPVNETGLFGLQYEIQGIL